MKFENLNQEKFEKIEKKELGKLVGGLMEGDTWTKTGEGSGLSHDADGNLITCTFSCDWERGPEGEKDKRYICDADMKMPADITTK